MTTLHRGARLALPWLLAAVLSACGWVDAGVSGGTDTSSGGGGSYVVGEGESLVPETGLLAEGESGQTVLIRGPEHAAAFRLDPDGTFSYVHDGSETTADSFVYAVEDGDGRGPERTVSITIAPRNDAPVTADLDLEVEPGGTLVFTVAASDPDDTELTFSASQPARGTLQQEPGSGRFTYTAAAQLGEDEFVVTVSDPHGAQAEARVRVRVVASPEPPPGDNRPPTLEPASLTVAEDQSVSLELTFADPDGDSLTFSVEPPEHGVASVDAHGVLTYSPAPDFNGKDRFDVTVSDGRGGSATARITVTVDPVNDAPQASDDGPYSVAPGGVLEIDSATLLGNDSDAETPAKDLVVVLAQCPGNGSLTANGRSCDQLVGVALSAGTRLRYRHESGTRDSFRYRASDGALTSAVANVAIEVNLPPVADDDCWDDDDWDDDDWDDDDKLRGKVVASDAESPTTLTYSVTEAPRLGTLELDAAAGTFVYQPDPAGARGQDSFRVAVTDPLGASAEATVTVISAVRIMPLGDSITAGAIDETGPDETEQVGYRKALRERIAAAGFGVDFVGSLSSGASRFDPSLVDAEHEGHSGWGDDQLAAAARGLLDATPTDMVLLHIGSNGLEPNAADVVTLLDSIDQWGSDTGIQATVFLARIIDQNPKDLNGFVDAYNLALDEIAAVRQAAGKDVVVVDMQRALWGADNLPDPTLYGDSLHPNEAGYERMAEAWFEAVAPQLRKCDDKRH